MKFALTRISRRLYIIAAKPRISSTRSVVYHQPQAVYHQREALYIISRRLYITAAKPRISSTRSVAYHQPQAVYHQREALHIISRRLYIINAKRCIGNGVQKAEQRSSSTQNSSLRFTEGGREGGPDLQIRNYKDIGKDSVRAQNYL